MEKSTLIAISLGVLVVISVVQSFQLSGLKNTVTGGSVVQTASQPAPAQANAPQATGAATGNAQPVSVPSSIQNLPDMVGGC